MLAPEIEQGVLVRARFPWIRAQRDADDYASPTRSLTGGPWLVLARHREFVNCLIEGNADWWLHVSVVTLVDPEE